METVFDYIKYYKNITFEESNFNDMDNIVFCTLSYLPLNNITIENTTLDVIFSKIKNNTDKSIVQNSLKVLKEIYNTKRYKTIQLSNYINIVDEQTQFSALTIRFGKGNCFVAYRGTDTSIIGWKEDFELSYTYPVPAQKLAYKYLKETIKFSDKNIYVGGHSKGGNLAMAAALEIEENIFKKIKNIYNNDGPGFLQEEYTTQKFKRVETKLKTFIPEESIVGILLENTSNYTVIKSKAIGIKQHDLTTWLCFGPFLKQGRLSVFSKELKIKINSWLQNSDNNKKETIVKNLFKIIQSTGATDLKDFKKINFKTIVNEVTGVDTEVKQLLLNTLTSFIK